MSGRARTVVSPVAKLAIFGVGLAAALGAGMLAGAAFGPEPSEDRQPAHEAEHDDQVRTASTVTTTQSEHP
jgi:hypothetical protein